jgi:hypothetical protein
VELLWGVRLSHASMTDKRAEVDMLRGVVVAAIGVVDD